MNAENVAAVGAPVEPPVRRPLGMPDYTPEQKAAAFDALWDTCGLGFGLLKDFVSRNISRPGCPDNEATMQRVPRYEFTILAEGEMRRFRDVLHHLATRKDA